MTIPIRPGPFSFLVPLGEGLGKIGALKEERRRYERDEAQQAATFLIAMREKGMIQPQAFSDPEIMDVFKAAGFAAPSTNQTFGEMKETAGRTMMQGGQVTTEQRLAAGLPTESAVEGEKLATSVNRSRNQVMESGTADQQAVVTGVPTPLSARTDALNRQNPALMQSAARYVSGAVVRAGGRIPNTPAAVNTLLQEAYSAYTAEVQQTPGVAPMPMAIFKSYFDAALMELVKWQKEQDNARAIAGMRAGADDTYRYLNALNAYMARIQDSIKSFDDMLASPMALFNYGKGQGMTVEQAKTYVTAQRDAMQQALQAARQGFGSVMNAGPNQAGQLGAGINTARKLTDEQAADFAGKMQRGEIKPYYLDQWIAKGEMTEADRQQIMKVMTPRINMR